MKTKDRDIQSYISIIDGFINNSSLEPEKSELIKKELKTHIKTKFSKGQWVHPEITKFCTDWYREFYRLVEEDPYKELKEKSNKKAIEVLETIKINDFREIILAGIIGNKIDYGATLLGDYNLNKMKEDFSKISSLSIHIDQTELLKEKIKSAKNILFLPDNNGEIIFDTLLLKELKKTFPIDKITIMAKESPMLNDVTVSDLESLNFKEFGMIRSTGSNCFGLHKEDVSKECIEILQNADLIIAKGQAYLEFFTEYNLENVFNLLRVKYPIVNPAFGTLDSGLNIVISSKIYSSFGKDYFT